MTYFKLIKMLFVKNYTQENIKMYEDNKKIMFIPCLIIFALAFALQKYQIIVLILCFLELFCVLSPNIIEWKITNYKLKQTFKCMEIETKIYAILNKIHTESIKNGSYEDYYKKIDSYYFMNFSRKTAEELDIIYIEALKLLQEVKNSIGILKYLKVLEISESIKDMTIISKQYKELLKKYHPDKCGYENDKIREITHAYGKIRRILNEKS